MHFVPIYFLVMAADTSPLGPSPSFYPFFTNSCAPSQPTGAVLKALEITNRQPCMAKPGDVDYSGSCISHSCDKVTELDGATPRKEGAVS